MDMSGLANVLNDPSIREMAQSISQDPSFQEMAKSLQGLGAAGGAAGAAAGGMPGGMPPGMPPGMAGMMGGMGGPGGAGMNPAQYQQMMGEVMKNPQFMKMAENLGKQLMGNPQMAQTMQQMQAPDYQAKVKEKMESLKEDPELAEMIKDIETGGPSAMMKYWNDPEKLQQLGKAMGPGFGGLPPGGLAAVEGEGAAEGDEEEGEEGEEGEEDEEDEELSLHSCASAGDYEGLAELLKEEGVDANEKDAEGRTALHFSCGYGEIKCAELLIEAGADAAAVDRNKNTPLHYAAGYGRKDATELLVKAGASCTALNSDGKSPVDVAKLNKQADVVAAMEQASFL